MECVVWERSLVEMRVENLVDAATKLVSCKDDRNGSAGRTGKSISS